MSQPGPDEERARLRGFIANSRRVQRWVLAIFGLGVAASLAGVGLDAPSPIPGVLLVAAVLVLVVGFWITKMHILDWSQQLAALDRTAARGATAGGEATAPSANPPPVPTQSPGDKTNMT